jgi:ABC-type Fe3+-hydroxamate transport system substrate-binding protein
MNKIEDLKTQTVNFIKEEKAKGKTICGYGASTKGNTLLQWFGLDNTLIDAIAERSPYKFGLKTIGTNIPILSEEEVRAMKPDYMLVLPWHFINEFVQRENEYLSNGGKFIVPCPKFEII